MMVCQRTVAIVVTLVLSGAGLRAQDLSVSPLVHQTDQIGGVGKDVYALCPGTAGVNAGELRQLHASRAAARRQAGQSLAARIDVACVRLALHLAGNPSIGGDGMQVGTSWVEGAIALLDSVLVEAPANEVAASLLWLGASQVLMEIPPASYDRIGGRSKIQRDLPSLTARLVRAVTEGARAPAVLRGCSSASLRIGDYSTSQWCNLAALKVGADSSWHLLRLGFAAALRGDARVSGQLVTLAIIAAQDEAARKDVAWHFAAMPRLEGLCVNCEAGNAIVVLPPERLVEAGTVDARRAIAVEAARMAATDTTQPRLPPRELGRMRAATGSGAGWEQRVVAHFGQTSYGAGTFRYCVPTGRASDARTLPCPPLPQLHDWTVQPIAKSHLLWDPASGAPIELVVYAVPVKQLERSPLAGGATGVDVSSQLLHWSLARSGVAETTVVRRLRLPEQVPSAATITGVITLPAREAENWGLHLMQPNLRRGGIWITGRTPLDSGDVRLSDLVLGAAGQGLSTVVGDTLTLGPLDSFDRRQPIMLQFQTRSDEAMERQATMRLIVSGVEDGIVGRVMLQTSSPIAFRGGIHWQRREIDLSKVAKGSYSLGVEVLDAAGGVVARRTTMLELR